MPHKITNLISSLGAVVFVTGLPVTGILRVGSVVPGDIDDVLTVLRVAGTLRGGVLRCVLRRSFGKTLLTISPTLFLMFDAKTVRFFLPTCSCKSKIESPCNQPKSKHSSWLSIFNFCLK